MMISETGASIPRATGEKEGMESDASSGTWQSGSTEFVAGWIGKEGSAAALTLTDAAMVATWCDRYGVTIEQLTRATTIVGLMPAALHFYLTSHGRPTKQLTNEMRASHVPIQPRDRRSKTPVVPREERAARELRLETERLETERSMRELNLHIARDALHERLSPKTIVAYDNAKKLLEETLAKLERTTALIVPGAGFTLKDGVS